MEVPEMSARNNKALNNRSDGGAELNQSDVGSERSVVMVTSSAGDFRDTDSDVMTSPETRVPDGGWGWFCVLGCALTHIVIGKQYVDDCYDFVIKVSLVNSVDQSVLI
jgi:hypothetical protein